MEVRFESSGQIRSCVCRLGNYGGRRHDVVENNLPHVNAGHEPARDGGDRL